MNAGTNDKRSLFIALLTLGALALLVAAYFSPIWWVALKAPNYPEHTFPDGIRIHFHVDGVFNGCGVRESKEVFEREALDCKGEMDTINHYVGMYPIAAGAPVERAFAPFVFALLGLMLVAFNIRGRGPRSAVLAAGCVAIGLWMSAALYAQGGVEQLSPGYLRDLQGTMDLDREDIADWSGFEAMQESYREALGRYFRDLTEIERRAQIIGTATHVVYGGLLAAMLVLVVGSWTSRPFYWLLIAVPLLLPLFFVIDYSAWLWWFGHNLSTMGAFTVKPFMPTVFGDGKVAQFSTHSYPAYGFALLVAASLLLAPAMLLRRLQFRDQEVGG